MSQKSNSIQFKLSVAARKESLKLWLVAAHFKCFASSSTCSSQSD